MIKSNKEIRDQYDFFRELLVENKIVTNKTIQIETKKSNSKWLIGTSNLEHETITDEIIFIVERNKRDSKYGIKLRCSTLTKEPFFRFDSDGPAHRNDDSQIPLEEQSVTTPHFNSFQKDGKPIAYKNETLKKEKEAEIIAADINFGVSLFCMETNSKLNTGDFPTVLDKNPEIEFDGNESVNFDNINFE